MNQILENKENRKRYLFNAGLNLWWGNIPALFYQLIDHSNRINFFTSSQSRVGSFSLVPENHGNKYQIRKYWKKAAYCKP